MRTWVGVYTDVSDRRIVHVYMYMQCWCVSSANYWFSLMWEWLPDKLLVIFDVGWGGANGFDVDASSTQNTSLSPLLLDQLKPVFQPGLVALAQSPPSQSHADTLHAWSQYLSVIQFGGHPSAQWGTDHAKNTWPGGGGGRRGEGRERGGRGRGEGEEDRIRIDKCTSEHYIATCSRC